MPIIDTHAHLDHCENIEQVLGRAAEEGVSAVIAVSEDLVSSQKNLHLSRTVQSPRVYCAAGVHPSHANINELDATLNFIRKNVKDLVAIGECGLDYWYKWVKKDESKKQEQRDVFRSCLELAKEIDVPVTFHSRGAWKDCLDIVRDVGIKKCVFHWYSGPKDILKDILANGFFISATPSLAYSPQAREAVEYAPMEQTLIETDTPVYYRNKETNNGFQSEPKDVWKTLDTYCSLKNIEKEKALDILNKNAQTFFSVCIS